jgi:hypothetical protein
MEATNASRWSSSGRRRPHNGHGRNHDGSYQIDNLSLHVIEAAAGALIELAPSCPCWANRAVDRLTICRDRLLVQEVWQ